MVRLALLLLLFARIPAAAAGDKALGRLFTTPDERASLDRARRSPGPEPAARVSTNGRTDAIPIKRYVLSGVARRPDGTGIAWINGSPVRHGQAFHGVTVLLDGTGAEARLLPDRSGRPVRLKPGQAWDSTTGRVSDPVGFTGSARQTR